MRIVEILITPSGKLTINAAGFTGTDCEKATAFLEQALGQLTAKQRKPEWHQRNQRTHQQKVGV
jgi:hypothetical protein